MNRDAYSRSKVVALYNNATVSADTWSLAIDLSTARADAILIIVSVGELSADASNTLAITLQELADGGTITDASAYSAVAAADIEGTELPVTINATGENAMHVAGYKGDARYLAVHMDETNTVSGPIAIAAVLLYLHEAPGANFTVTTGQPA